MTTNAEPPPRAWLTWQDETNADRLQRRTINIAIRDILEMPNSRERALAITKLEEAVFWLEKDMKRIEKATNDPSNHDRR